MKNLKKNQGITLIALVITIIVMLILVAVTITIAVNGGLFDYAGKAAADTNTMIEEEQDWSNIATGQDYEQLITKYATRKATWTHTGTGTDIGDVYTTGGEYFYVIGSDSTAVTLLAAKCVDTRAEVENVTNANYNKQTDTTYPVAFDSTDSTNVYANSTIKPLVDSYVASLGVSVIEGRLMTKEDVVALRGSIEKTSTKDCPAFINEKNYWLSSPYENYKRLTWIVEGGRKTLSYNRVSRIDVGYGLRPVIVISKSNI